MHTNSYDSVAAALQGLRERGYTEDLNLAPDCLVCASRALQLHPEDFTVDEVHRFEGMSNPDDSAVVFAISSRQGLRGVLVDAYGMYAEALTPALASRLHTGYKQTP